ncbi:hypothetical protein STEG23_038109 [Scotinomys teguina]
MELTWEMQEVAERALLIYCIYWAFFASLLGSFLSAGFSGTVVCCLVVLCFTPSIHLGMSVIIVYYKAELEKPENLEDLPEKMKSYSEFLEKRPSWLARDETIVVGFLITTVFLFSIFPSCNGSDYSIVYMYHIFLIHSSVEGHLGCFQVLAITNNAAMNIVEHVSLWYDWAFFGYMPKSGSDIQCRCVREYFQNSLLSGSDFGIFVKD